MSRTVPWTAQKNRTTKNWMEETNSLEKKKEKKKTLRRLSKCHVFVKQVFKKKNFFNGDPPRTPPLEGTSLHRRNISVERPWGILSLFTTCLPLWVKSSHQSRCHTSPIRSARKNRTRKKKSAGEEDPRKSPEKIKKNEPLEKLKSTESLKRERP